jgi:putative ABC transport system permease protein
VHPIGRRFRLFADGMPWVTVVGVVADTRVDAITEPPPPVMYIPHAQAARTSYFTAPSMTLMVRATTDPMPLAAVRRLDEVISSTIAEHTFTTKLLAGFAAIALALAAIGIYGVLAYGVAQRRYELGVRMALGAGASAVLKIVVMEAVALALGGLALGVIGALAVARVLRASIPDVGEVDLGVLAAAAACLLLVATLALLLPARSAVRVHPTEALRNG